MDSPVRYNVTFLKLMARFREQRLFGPDATAEEMEYGLGSFYPAPGGLADNLRWFLSDDAQIIEYAKKLQALGAENVLVSMAENGAILLDESGAVHRAENARGTLVNSVGCGDSMLAGFLAGCDKGDYA